MSMRVMFALNPDESTCSLASSEIIFYPSRLESAGAVRDQVVERDIYECRGAARSRSSWKEPGSAEYLNAFIF